MCDLVGGAGSDRTTSSGFPTFAFWIWKHNLLLICCFLKTDRTLARFKQQGYQTLSHTHTQRRVYVIACQLFLFASNIQEMSNTFAPKASPEITATVTPPWLGLGISDPLSSWYIGSTSLSRLGRFTHSCKPTTGSSEIGISAWTTPCPAVIHWWMRTHISDIRKTQMSHRQNDFVLSSCCKL